MTGYDIINRAAALSGITEDVISGVGRSRSVLDLINQLLADLKAPEISGLSETVRDDKKKTEAVCYGLAMLTALANGDTQKNRVFTDLYNAKRCSALNGKGIIFDTLPKTVMR